MKKITFTMVLLAVCTTMSFADFDYTISNTYELSVELDGQESLLIAGGGAYQIVAFDFSYIEIWNTTPLGSIGGIYTIDLDDDSTLNYLGGESGGLNIDGDAAAVLQGGSINYLSSWQNIASGPHIEIVCNDHEYFDDYAIEYGEPIDLLRVQWDVGGGWINIKLVDQDPQWYAPVIDNVFFTPEPTSLVLFGLGGFLLRRKRN